MLIDQVIRALDERRRQARLSQRQVGARCGTAQATVSQLFNQRWENVQLKTLTRLATALGVELSFNARWKCPVTYFAGVQIFTCFCGWTRTATFGMFHHDDVQEDGRWLISLDSSSPGVELVDEHVTTCRDAYPRYRTRLV
jgi:transcriptional regulator with XRE-family HTH domain